MIVRNLLAIFQGRRRPIAYGPQVLVTMERPWEAGRVRRFGPVDEVLRNLTVRDLVESLAEAGSPPEPGAEDMQEILPACYDIQVQSATDSDFRAVSGDDTAVSLLGEALTAPDRPHVHQLRIRIMPLPADGNDERIAPVRHSDGSATHLPLPILDEDDLADQLGVPARPVSRTEAPEKAEAPQKSEAPEKVKTAPAPSKANIRGYVRKTDVLRAELLPKLEALDFSGLFVGNFGIQSRTLDKAHRVSLLDPETANRYLIIANQHRRDGEHDKAIHYYKTLVTHDPDNEDFWFLLGKTAADLGRVKQAAHAFSTAKRLGHSAAKDELTILRTQYPELAEKTGDLVSLWRQSYD